MSDEPRPSAVEFVQRSLLLAVVQLVVWGPAVGVGVIVWLTTGYLWAGLLGVAVTFAGTSRVIRATASRQRERRERDEPSGA